MNTIYCHHIPKHATIVMLFHSRMCLCKCMYKICSEIKVETRIKTKNVKIIHQVRVEYHKFRLSSHLCQLCCKVHSGQRSKLSDYLPVRTFSNRPSFQGRPTRFSNPKWSGPSIQIKSIFVLNF